MSALKENPLCWEVDGKLKFAKLPRSNILALSEKAKAVDAINKQRPWGYKGTQTLAKNPVEPTPNRTPREWRRVSIEERAEQFNLVTAGARIRFLPLAKKVLGIDLPTDGLTFEQAVANGNAVEAAYKRLEL